MDVIEVIDENGVARPTPPIMTLEARRYILQHLGIKYFKQVILFGPTVDMPAAKRIVERELARYLPEALAKIRKYCAVASEDGREQLRRDIASVVGTNI